MKVDISRPTAKGRSSCRVKIHEWDVWDVDWTVATIVLPLLLKVRECKRCIPSSAFDDPNDISDESWMKAENNWKGILDKIIWSMKEISQGERYPNMPDFAIYRKRGMSRKQARDKLYNGIFKRGERDPELEKAGEEWMKECNEIDRKVQEGCDLFGKYFRSLWS